MNPGRKPGLLIPVAMGIFVFLLINSLRTPEPVFHGKKVSYWIEQKAGGTNDWQEITNAFYTIGPKAVPYVIARLRKDKSWSHKFNAALWPRLPPILSNRLSPPAENYSEVAPVNIFCDIGPAVIPSLIRFANDENISLRASVAWAMGSLERKGHNASDCIPTLIGLLADSDAKVRGAAARALGEFGPKAFPAVPALMQRLNDDEKSPKGTSVYYVRAPAARALGLIGPSARSANSLLSALCTDSNLYNRMEAAIALWRIEHQTNVALPLLMDALPKTQDPAKWEIFEALGEMGPDARTAVPAIATNLHSKWSEARQRAAEALWKIDPGQAPMIVQALVEGFDRPGDLYCLVMGSELLGDIGPSALSAVPALLGLLTNQQPQARIAAAVALKKIDPDAAAKAGIK